MKGHESFKADVGMKVMILNAHLSKVMGGSEVACHINTKAFVDKGYDAVYGAVNGYDKSVDWPYPIVEVNKQDQKDLVSFLLKHNVDVLYWNYNKKIIWPNFKNIRKAGIPIFVSVNHVNDLQYYPKKKPYKSPLVVIKHNLKKISKAFHFFQARKMINGYIAINQEHMDLIPSRFNKTFIPFGVFDEFVEPEPAPRPYVVWMASIKKVKNPELFLELAKALEHLDLDFYLIGKAQEEYYLNWGEEAAQQKNLKFLGGQEMKMANGFIKNSKLFISTCDPEGFPMVYLQSWVFGRPVISMNYDPSGVIERERLGYCSHGNFKKFVTQVESLVKDDDTYAEISTSCRRYIDKHHNVSRNVDKLIAYFNVLKEQ
ncbi:MAG: glycosyltransferase involved in cell wall biosynthesis [Parvicella sp.]|jgi:glycosyltransferase involved in cell wall biosynthesis